VIPLPRPIARLTHARLPDGRLVDVELEDGRVAAVRPAFEPGAPGTPPFPPGPAQVDTLALDGFVLVPAPADPHAHLDKALSWDAIRPPMGDLELAITSWRAHAATMTEDDVAGRARTQALRMLAQGTTAVRTHVDVLLGPDPLRGVRALLRVREELRGLMDLELVALASHLTPVRDIEAALAAGVDTVGGAPHLAPDPLPEMYRLLGIARAHGVGIDLHTDENLTCPVTLDVFARAVRGWGAPVTAGHCVRLGTVEPEDRDRVIADVLAAGLGVVANPITNLYLQGWATDVATPRGLTAVRALVDAGVRFAAGADNVRDPFNPLGRGDALETAMLLVVAGHLSVDEAYHAVSVGARDVMGLPTAGVEPGARADLLAVRGTDLVDVVANAPADRYVLHGGHLVAASETRTSVATPALVPTA
jgi:cytosine/creatinine deaminase